jgi:hypothetical protein
MITVRIIPATEADIPRGKVLETAVSWVTWIVAASGSFKRNVKQHGPRSHQAELEILINEARS